MGIPVGIPNMYMGVWRLMNLHGSACVIIFIHHSEYSYIYIYIYIYTKYTDTLDIPTQGVGYMYRGVQMHPRRRKMGHGNPLGTKNKEVMGDKI